MALAKDNGLYHFKIVTISYPKCGCYIVVQLVFYLLTTNYRGKQDPVDTLVGTKVNQTSTSGIRHVALNSIECMSD